MNKNRLVKLLNDVKNMNVEEQADYLLENGIEVPPCKVGDIVYSFYGEIEDKIAGKKGKTKIHRTIPPNESWFYRCLKYGKILIQPKKYVKSDINKWGIFIFGSEEEAKQALTNRIKEDDNNGC